MSRVINVNSPTKIRNHHRRTIAEILRQLMQKASFDAEAKDMAAFIVLALQEIYDVSETSAAAWEKRGYWMKAERFLREWRWAIECAADLDDVLRNEAWDLVPELIITIYPRFTDIELKRMLRKPETWQGAYQRLMATEPRPLPY
ncbi:MAG: hypothetical protein KDE04_11065 [Anaerolineales bacterium]|nr:hypothetical protein [Anaerolineales bacterium]MCB0015869.1 hypothetical protein [Anaerolineales bacterium]